MKKVQRRGTAVAAAAALALSFAACGTGTDRRAISAASVAGGAGFNPEDVLVDKEDTVHLRVGNTTDRTHGFSIEGYRIQREVKPNETLDVRFKASRGGTFKIYCQLHPTHRTATLLVR